MVSAYSANVLDIVFQNRIHFHLELRGRITQVYGESATGKSLLGYVIRATEKYNRGNPDVEYDVSKVLYIDSLEEMNKIKNRSGDLIIIDRGDAFLTDDQVNMIREDKNNTYLVISRRILDLGISPNYYAEFVECDGRVELRYKYSVEGWN